MVSFAIIRRFSLFTLSCGFFVQENCSKWLKDYSDNISELKENYLFLTHDIISIKVNFILFYSFILILYLTRLIRDIFYIFSIYVMLRWSWYILYSIVQFIILCKYTYIIHNHVNHVTFILIIKSIYNIVMSPIFFLEKKRNFKWPSVQRLQYPI